MKKTFTKVITLLSLSCMLLFGNGTNAQSMFEDFDDITTIMGVTWTGSNMSNPVGSSDWFQGNGATVFPSLTGVDVNSYIGANYNNTGNTGTISNWLITPSLNVKNGDEFSFWTQVPVQTTTEYPDRLQLRLNLNNTDYVGTSELDSGDFTILLVDINPELITGVYPQAWARYSAVLSGITGTVPATFAFRYFVTDAGFSGANSNYIGIDSVYFNSVPVGVKETSSTINANIFPNPTSDYLKIVFGQPLSSNTTLTVCDELGKTIYTSSIAANQIVAKIDVKEFAKGNYIVRMVNDTETLTTKFTVN